MTAATEAAAAPRPRPAFAELLSLPVLSWALYDFANTIFSYAVVTRYFNEWIIEERGNPDWYVGALGFVVAVFLVATMPPLGAIADRYGRRKPFLIAFTLLCVAATALLGQVEHTLVALAVAGVAMFAFQSALPHYDPLLADVAPPEGRGRISGLGVGLGYGGVLVALAVLTLLVPEGDNQRAFLPTALMFLVFALPCFLFVRERRPRGKVDHPPPGRVVREALGQLRSTVREARRYSAVGRFLLGRFLYVDAVATVIVYMTVYAERIGDLSAGAKTALLGVSVAFAALGAVLAGVLVERHGPRRTLLAILGIFTVTLVGAAVFAVPASLWIVGPVVGIALGTIGASDRVFMLRLSPPAYRGEFFALFGLVGKLSSGVGPLVIWGGTIWLLHDLTDVLSEAGATRVAVVGLALACAAGLLTIRTLSDAPRWPEPAE